LSFQQRGVRHDSSHDRDRGLAPMQERYVLICMPSHAVWRAALRPAPFAARRAGELTRSPRPRWLAASSVWSGKRLGSLQIDFQNPTRVDAGQTVDIRVSGTLPTGGDPILQLGRRWGRVSERRPAAGLPPRISEPSKGADHRTGDSQSAPARPIGPFQRSPSRVTIGRPKCGWPRPRSGLFLGTRLRSLGSSP
jgi:hypothetical protein